MYRRSATHNGRIVTSPSESSGSDVTQLLMAWRRGDESAIDRLLPIIYEELRRVADRAMRRESPGHSLQPTALLHEAYLKLVDQDRAVYRSRAHFFAIAAQVMRRILVDHARERLAAKRGGGAIQVTLDGVVAGAEGSASLDVIVLHDALDALGAIDPFQARLVEMRYFSGLNIEETAEALDVSPATVKREWVIARSWLRRALGAA
ncbi:MAG: sigma-70 family RNA polymerase sigma factor [Gemmatimonadaceae bacterium]